MKVSNVIAMLLISAILCSCNSEQLCNEQSVQDNAIAIETVKSVTETISNSNLSKELKKSIMDGISVADASAKLWNTSEIVSIPAK